MQYTESELKDKVLTDSRFQDIGNLPSNFFPYPNFKKLYIRPFNFGELKFVSKAAALKEVSHLIRAIDLVISENVNELSIGDFYYILMWLRIHSFPKTPLVVEWHCPEQVLTNKETCVIVPNDASFVEPSDPENYEMRYCATHNTELIHMTSVEIYSLDETNFQALPEGFDFPRVKHLEDIQTAVKDPELQFIAGAAQWIEGDTFADKIKKLEDQPDLSMYNMAFALNEKIQHGVGESTTLTCRHCRGKQPFVIAIDALTFFR